MKQEKKKICIYSISKLRVIIMIREIYMYFFIFEERVLDLLDYSIQRQIDS